MSQAPFGLVIVAGDTLLTEGRYKPMNDELISRLMGKLEAWETVDLLLLVEKLNALIKAREDTA